MMVLCELVLQTLEEGANGYHGCMTNRENEQTDWTKFARFLEGKDRFVINVT